MLNIAERNKDQIQELATAAKYGDKEALGDLYEMTRSAVYSVVITSGVKKHDVDDTCGTIYAKLCKKIGQFDENNLFVNWFNKIVERCILDQKRKYYSGRKKADNGAGSGDGDSGNSNTMVFLSLDDDVNEITRDTFLVELFPYAEIEYKEIMVTRGLLLRYCSVIRLNFQSCREGSSYR